MRIGRATASEMRDDLFTEDGNENFGILFCVECKQHSGTTLLARHWENAPRDAYVERLPYHLEISPAYLNRVVDLAVSTGDTPIIVHSHPASQAAQYSASDDYGERRLLPVLEALLPGMRVASLLCSLQEFTGRHWSGHGFSNLYEIDVAGVRYPSPLMGPPRRGTRRKVAGIDQFDRQVRAIGEAGHQQLARLRVGIVGLGGTGSSVAEQIARVGVKDIVLVDPDRVEASNLPRMWGTVPKDAVSKRTKASVIAAHLESITPALRTRTIVDSVIRQSVLAQLTDRHLVFGCTDNHWSRAVLNRFAHQYLIPVIDMGIRIDGRDRDRPAIGGQVSLLGQGWGCARCSGLVDQSLVRAESMAGTERQRLAKEGYVQGVQDPAPTVISLNATITGLAVTLGLQLTTRFSGELFETQLRYDGVRGEVFPVKARHDVGCDVCDPQDGVIGLGDSQVVSAYE